MPISIACPTCGAEVAANAASTAHACTACGAHFEVVIHLASQSDEVVAMVVDDVEPTEEAAAAVEAEVVAEPVDEPVEATLVAAAPAPTRDGKLRSADLAAELASARLEDDRVARYREEHAKDAKIPLWGWAATISVSVLPILAWAWNFNGIRDVFSDPQIARRSASPAGDDYDNLQQAKYHAEEDESLADVYQAIEFGIVKIETRDAAGRSSGVGSGFVIDAGGLVATSLHVLSDSVEAEAVFNDGSRYPIAGYVAKSAASDLAIVKLESAPVKLTVLKLSTEAPPRKATHVVAIGHPQNHAFVPTSGIVGRVVHSSQLPPRAQEFLHYAPAGQDNVWIEHDAAIAPGSSGGPLIDHQGAVLGVNTWINPDIKLGFALHAQHLTALLREVGPEVTPLTGEEP